MPLQEGQPEKLRGPVMDFRSRIQQLKEEKDAFILAHYYQRREIQEVADFIGDSLELSRKCADIPNSTIVFCGVYFMAEIAKILAPGKRVLIPYKNAGCLLADMAIPDEVELFKRRYPDAKVIAYVNTYAEVKAVADVICTSANAGDVIRKVDASKVIFLPDGNLGAYHSRFVDKEVITWKGYCPVHNRITWESIERVKAEHPDALVIVHPECPPEVTEKADFVGSTSQLVRFVAESSHNKFIVGTEEGTLYKMQLAAPDKEFLLPDPVPLCDQMKMITPERLIRCLEEGIYEVEVEPQIAEKAEKAIEVMFKL